MGILGGMGPEASSSFYHKILDISQKKYSAVQDNHYPELLIYSLALEGFDETGIQDEKLVLKQLSDGINLRSVKVDAQISDRLNKLIQEKIDKFV